MKKEKTIITSFIAIGSGTIINMVLGLITTPIITRIVDPEQYGQMSIFDMYTSIALMVLCFGLDQALVRFFYEKEDITYRKTLLRFCVIIPLFVSTIASAGVCAFAYVFDTVFEFEWLIILFLCINVLVSIFNRISLLVLRLTYQSKKFAVCNVAHRASYIAIALTLLLLGVVEQLWALIIATVLSLVISSAIAVLSAKEYWSLRCCKSKLDKQAVVKYGMPFVVSMGITTIFQACDKMALNYYCTYSDVGIYSSAMTLVSVFAIIQTTFNTIWAPMLVEHITVNPENKQFIQKVNKYITIVMFGLGFCLIFAKDLFVFLLGDKYREAAYILPFLIFNPIMYTISETTQPGIEYSKKSYLNIFAALVPCVFNIIGNMFLVPMFGAKGAAISTGLSYILFFIMRTTLSNRYYYVDYKLWKFAIVTVVAIGYAGYNTFVSFGAGAVISFLISMLVLIALYYKDIKEILNVIQNQIRKLINKKHEKQSF